MILAFIQAIENEEQKKIAEKIFEEQYSRMKTIAYSILNNREDTEDAAMTAIHSICDNITEFEDYASPLSIALICIYTRNAAIDIYRKNRKNSANLQYMNENTVCADFTDIPEDIVITEENTQRLLEAIKSLDDMYRIPLIMKYVYSMKHDAIGKHLNIDAGTVSGRVFRARQQLAKILTEQEQKYARK